MRIEMISFANVKMLHEQGAIKAGKATNKALTSSLTGRCKNSSHQPNFH